VSHQVEAYLDGELHEAARAHVAEHLEACERCRGAAEGLRELGAALRESAGEALTAAEAATFESAVRARIREAEVVAERHSLASLARAVARYIRGPILVPALAVLLGIILGVGILRNGAVRDAAEAAEVETLEVGPTSTVMVIQEGRGKPPVIWIFEDGAGAN
jgi:anti-sigma factor RsiW